MKKENEIQINEDFSYCYSEIKKNLGTMYDPIIGEYVLEHWEEVTGRKPPEEA